MKKNPWAIFIKQIKIAQKFKLAKGLSSTDIIREDRDRV